MKDETRPNGHNAAMRRQRKHRPEVIPTPPAPVVKREPLIVPIDPANYPPLVHVETTHCCLSPKNWQRVPDRYGRRDYEGTVCKKCGRHLGHHPIKEG